MKNEILVHDHVKLIPDQSGYYHLLLKITNIYDNKIYVCKHSTKNPYDRYMGSSKYILQDIKAYGIDVFTKEIIECAESAEILTLYEKSVVDYDFLKHNYTYNINVGGGGPKVHVMTRKRYLSQLNREKQKHENKKKQEKQVIELINDTKLESNLEFHFYKFLHKCIQLVKLLIFKLISIGISLTYLFKTIIN